MKNIRVLGAALAASLLLVACGGGDDAKNTSPYGKLVVFGDSLSDVGTHATQGVVLGTAGGKYTVNGLGVKIWVEGLADELGVAVPCAARVGLESAPESAGGRFSRLGQAPADVAGCYGYAQGGSRVTNPVGPWNKALPSTLGGDLGQLTEPVVAQVAHHLRDNAFASDDLVTVLAGANDVFMKLGEVAAGLPPADAVAAMGAAAGELVALIKGEMIAKGAKRIVVVNVPDIATTPSFLGRDAPTRALVTGMLQTFNGTLAAGLANTPQVLLVDAYAQSQAQVANPATYGLSNVTDRACDAAKAFASLVCSAATVIAGDVSRYLFADDVHPTPYGHQLLEGYVVQQLVKAGWR